MAKKPAKEKPNLLVELAKRKAEAQASGKKPGILGKDLSSRFASSGTYQPPAKRGGRNGSGKPT